MDLFLKKSLPFMLELEHKVITEDTIHIKSITMSCQFFLLMTPQLFLFFPTAALLM